MAKIKKFSREPVPGVTFDFTVGPEIISKEMNENGLNLFVKACWNVQVAPDALTRCMVRIRELEAQLELSSRWIPLSETLPPEVDVVFILTDCGDIGRAYQMGGDWTFVSPARGWVVAWMHTPPLPPGLEEDSDG